MKVRPAIEEDLVEVSRLWLCLVMETDENCIPNMEWWLKMATTMFRTGSYHIVVAMDGNALVGFIDYLLVPSAEYSQIHMVGQYMYVLQEYRNSNIAETMYKKAIRMAKRQGATTREIVCLENKKSMWEKKGYKVGKYSLYKPL